MRVKEFFATHPVFTNAEFTKHLEAGGSSNIKTKESLLAYHVRQGNLLRIRRGLYMAVPLGMKPETCPTDPYLIAAKMTDDAVLAYHTALEFHGKAYSVFEQFQYLTMRSGRQTKFRSYTFSGVRPPKALGDQNIKFGIKTMERSGLDVRVTSLERTLVDLMDRPILGGSWEEIWRSLEGIEFFDLKQVVEYALLLRNATTVARVGFFLEQHRESLMVTDHYLEMLRKHKPKAPHYFERGKPGHLVKPWNLMVPESILERSWQEVG
jgi:predicted transcriptional regulator of viral defense system